MSVDSSRTTGAGDSIGELVQPSNVALANLIGGIPKKEDLKLKDAVVEEPTNQGGDLEPPAPARQQTEPKKEDKPDGSNVIVKTGGDLEGDDKNKSQQQQQQSQQQQQQQDDKNKGGNNEPVTESSIIAEFASEFGEVDNLDSFEEDTEGLKEYFKAVIPSIRQDAKQEAVAELFEQAPILGELANHLAKGYGFDSFKKKFEAFDYSKLEVKEDNVKLQEQLYRSALKAKGNDDDDIDDFVNAAKDAGKLFEKSKTAITFLDNHQQAQLKQIQDAEKAERDAQIKAEQETAKEIDKILKSGTIAGIKFDNAVLKSLREANDTVNNKGVSTLQDKWNNLTLEQQILLDIIVNNDFKDLGVKQTPASTQTRKLSDIKKKVAEQPKVDLTTSRNGTVEGIKGTKLQEYLQAN